jgi:hypothetical protein
MSSALVYKQLVALLPDGRWPPRMGAPVKGATNIRSGFGSVPVVDTEAFQQGPWERDRVVFERELYFACIHWG